MDTRTRWALGVILTALVIAIVVAAVAGSASAGLLPPSSKCCSAVDFKLTFWLYLLREILPLQRARNPAMRAWILGYLSLSM